jgi:hypothetical protein
MLNALLTSEGLRALHDASAGRHVLSVYIDSTHRDAAVRDQWRLWLAGELAAIDSTLVDPAERLQFRAAVDHVRAALAEVGGPLPGTTWAAFATRDSVLHAAALPRIARQRVRWRPFALVGPYIRALKQHRIVIAAVVDSARARLFQYEHGDAWELLDYRADRFIDDLSDRNTSKRATTHSGVRGSTASDTADRALQVQTQRMLGDVATAARHAASEHGLVLLGGNARQRAELRRMLPQDLADRVAEIDSVFVTMSTAAMVPVLAAGASELSRSIARAAAVEILELAGARGRGVVGPDAALVAARAGNVDLLLVSERFVDAREELAEELIAETLRHGGAIDEVGGDAAVLLDAQPGGVAARLRYAPAAQLRPHAMDTAG